MNEYESVRKKGADNAMPSKPGLHIRVIDDDPNVRTLLRCCFEGEDFSMSEAKDGLNVSIITLIGKGDGRLLQINAISGQDGHNRIA